MQLHRAREQFEAAGLRLVLIGQATPQDAARFRRQLGIDLPVRADEQRASYRAMDLEVASVGALIGPRVVARGILASARSRVTQGLTVGHPAQLGGAVVINPDSQIVWAQRARDASDNATPAQILAAARDA